MRGALAQAAAATPDFSPDQVIGIGVDTTGSSPIPVDETNIPLALNGSGATTSPRNAGCGRTTRATARRRASRSWPPSIRPQFIAKCGNTYSSEWFWSKIWHCLEVAPESSTRLIAGSSSATASRPSWRASPIRVRSNAASARPATRRSTTKTGAGCPTRNSWRCSTRSWPRCATGSTTKRTMPRRPAGHLSAAWAKKLGLPAGIPIAIGEFDVHYGAIGCGVDEGTLVKVIGTSTCDCARGQRGQKRSRTSPASAASSRARSCRAITASRRANRPSAISSNGGSKRICQGDGAMHARVQPSGRRAEARPARPAGPGLEQRQPHDPGRSDAHRPDPRPDAAHHGGGDLSRADRGHGLRRARDHRAAARIRRAGRTRGLRGRHRGEKSDAHADLRRRDGLHDADVRLLRRPARSGSAVSAAVLAGAHPDFPAAQTRHDFAQSRKPTRRSARTARSTTRSTRSTASCTMPSAASHRVPIFRG